LVRLLRLVNPPGIAASCSHFLATLRVETLRGGFRYTRPVVFAEGFSTITVVLRSCQSPEESGV
jgi:hypothetical protein